jgi:DNA-directed RNA polymerase subunit RPC12/RpoP
MAQLIGGKGQTPQPQQPKIDLSQAKEITCQNCGGTIFINGNKFLKIPKISAGTSQDVLIPVEVFLCGDCGELCEELLPKEFKNK